MQEKGENQQKQTHGIHVCIMAFSFATLALLLQEQTSVVGILGLDTAWDGDWTEVLIQGFCFPHR